MRRARGSVPCPVSHQLLPAPPLPPLPVPPHPTVKHAAGGAEGVGLQDPVLNTTPVDEGHLLPPLPPPTLHGRRQGGIARAGQGIGAGNDATGGVQHAPPQPEHQVQGALLTNAAGG